MTASAELIATREGGITRLSLNRPDKGNALSPSLVESISDALDTARGDGTRLLVLSSTSKHFCTGFDLADLPTQTDDSLMARLVRIELMLQRVHTAPFATLALASGRAMGAGADLFAACESRWIVGAASFAYPGAGFGVVLGTARLTDLVGASQARNWVCAGKTIDTEEALRSGLATARHTQDEANSATLILGASMARLDIATHEAMRTASLARGSAGGHHDLSALVRSASRPGLKARIEAYRRAAAG